MEPGKANLINGVVLIALGIWGYISTMSSVGGASPTALIAPAFGLLFLILTPALRKENKVVAHIVVLFTFVLMIMMFMPFSKAIGRGDTSAMLRVGTMLVSCLIAFVVYIMSFVKARKARK